VNNRDSKDAFHNSVTPVKEEVLEAMKSEVRDYASEGSTQQGAEPQDAAMGRARPIRSVVYNNVQVKDTMGVALLGALAGILLIALLAAHRRERKHR
jgi:hypothetical protein